MCKASALGGKEGAGRESESQQPAARRGLGRKGLSAGSPRAAPQVWEVLGKAEVRSHWDPRGDAASVGRGLPGRPCHTRPWAGSSLCGLGLCANVVIEFRVWPLCPGTVALAAIGSGS